MLYKLLQIIGHMWFIRLGIRYRIILPVAYTHTAFSVPFFGYIYKGNLSDYIDKFVYFFGAYEREELLYIKKYLRPHSVVFDVGANTGHHSLFFSRYAQCVYSFEPYQNMFRILESRIADNHIYNIKPYMFGLGEASQSLDFYAPKGKNKGVGSFVKSEAGENIGKLEIKKGDDVVSSLGVNHVHFIKIDVEGMEISVVKGLLGTILAHTPVMFIEMSPVSQRILEDQLKSILSMYNFYIVKANNPALLFFNKPTCLLKDFVPTSKTENIICIPR